MALPAIAVDLDTKDTITWAGTSSLLGYTPFQLLYGHLSDTFGRKTISLGAVLLLGAGDLLYGLSVNATML